MSARDFIAEAFRNPADWTIVNEDFIAEGASNVPNSLMFDIVKDTNASAICEADQQHGVLLMSSQATTDNDGNLVQSINEFIKPESGKRFAVEFVGVRSSDADQQDVFLGLAQRASTNPENTLTASNRIGFQVDDGNASILLKSEASDLETSKDSEQDLADAVAVKLGLAYNGSRLMFYVNDSPVGSIESNIPATELAIAMHQLSGDASGTKTLRVDRVIAVAER